MDLLDLDLITTPVLILNNQNKILNVNNGLCELFLYKKQEIIGCDINKLLYTKDSICYKKNCFPYYLLIKTAKNFLIKLQIDIEFLKDTNMMIFFKSEIPDLSESLAMIGKWRLNCITGIVSFSKEYSRLHNIDIYQNNLHLDEWLEKLFSINKKCISDKINICIRQKSHIEFIHKNSKNRYLLTKGIYIDKFIIGYCQDITETVKYKKQIEEQKRIALKESMFKTVFIANISHEIRTPINGILGLTTLLKDTPLSKEQSEYIDMILDSGGILLSLINNILEFSKIESGNVNITHENIDLQELVKFLKKSYQERIYKKGLNLNIFLDKDLPNYIITDNVKFRQIITNLINNSIKFTNYGNIDVFFRKYKEKYIQVTVKDQGIGIPGDKIKKLFKPFSQVDESSTREHEGTGLGLSICKKLVKLLKGNIKLFSIENKGTRVMFKIPLMFDKDINYKKDNFIAIIEDNVQNMFVIKKFTEKISDKSILQFKNGNDAVNGLKNKNPSLILLDLHMPIMDGFNCSRKLRENNIKCPIIAVTANALDGILTKCIKNGMNDILIKPFKFEDLKSKINKWI